MTIVFWSCCLFEQTTVTKNMEQDINLLLSLRSDTHYRRMELHHPINLNFILLVFLGFVRAVSFSLQIKNIIVPFNVTFE